MSSSLTHVILLVNDTVVYSFQPVIHNKNLFGANGGNFYTSITIFSATQSWWSQ